MDMDLGLGRIGNHIPNVINIGLSTNTAFGS